MSLDVHRAPDESSEHTAVGKLTEIHSALIDCPGKNLRKVVKRKYVDGPGSPAHEYRGRLEGGKIADEGK